ncbi:MAG: DegT/DnrJ/EryC1/StrS family aminotransferase [Candidatus Altiarchaeia archaeon]
MIPIAKPIIGEREKELVMQVLSSGMIAQGPKVKEFEKNWAEYNGVAHAIAVSSGTAALHIALLSHGIGPGDEVITTPFTFIASANSIFYCGAKPVFADIDEKTYNIDPEKVTEKITGKTKAIMPVHLYGQSADMKALTKIAEENEIAIVEDACQAHGAEYDGKLVGSDSTSAYSFYPTKNMTSGEGGMITTNDPALDEKMRMLREHGSKARYHHDILGYNYRMTDIAAAIGIAQLERLPSCNEARIKNAAYLDRKLAGAKGIITPYVANGAKHVYHQYTIRVTEESGYERDAFAKMLNGKGIGTGIHYPIPLHRQVLYQNLGYADNLPVAEKAAREVVSLPVHPSVSAKDLDYISETIRGALG